MIRKAIIISVSGTSLTKEESSIIKKEKPWGIILFRRNISSKKQVIDLINSIKNIMRDKKYPILIDEESGRVSRFSNFLDNSYFNQKYYLKKKSSYVITIYDLIKEKFYNDKFKNEEVNKIKYFGCMDKIICISENTKKDLIDHYKLSPELIEVVHLGVSFDKSYIEIDNKIPKKPYLLFVGERDRYKNFKNFILAYTKSNRLKKDFDILCFGGNSFTSEEINFFKEFRITQNIKQIIGSDLELNYVYKKARCFIFPSLYEGFGLPLLEAMNMDCPVICSDTSCFSEVTNNAAAMFDPNNIENIKHEIENVVYDEQKFSGLIIKGRNNIKNFSWQKCADQTLKVYNSIL